MDEHPDPEPESEPAPKLKPILRRRRHRKPARPSPRPRTVVLDHDTFRGLCELQCTITEIASFFRVSISSIERWCQYEYGENFSTVFESLGGPGKISLRRTQWRLAERNPALAIWLGKQYLGQRDRTEIAGDGGGPLVVKWQIEAPLRVGAATDGPQQIEGSRQPTLLPDES